MDAFAISFDAERRRMRIVVRGMMTPDDVPLFAAELNARVRAAGIDFDGIVESLKFPVQTHEVSDMLGMLGQGIMSRMTGRVAVVVASALNKMQVDRTLANPRLRVFRTLNEAERWLDMSTVEAT